MSALHSIRWGILSFCVLLIGCADRSPEPEKKPQPKRVRELVGKIASVSQDQTYVLIQSYGKWNETAGTVLSSGGLEGRVANLLVTGEKLGQFAAADLRSGDVAIGDAVFRMQVMSAPVLPEKELETSQAPSDAPLSPP